MARGLDGKRPYGQEGGWPEGQGAWWLKVFLARGQDGEREKRPMARGPEGLVAKKLTARWSRRTEVNKP